MKLATLRVDGAKTVAVVDAEGEKYWPVSELCDGFSDDMVQLVQQFADLRETLKPRGEGKPLASARLLAPIDQPRRNVFCVGKNYHDHAEEFSKSGFDKSAQAGEHIPEAPVVFTKPVSTIIATGERIPRHADVTQQMDYEVEIGVVIGKAGRGIKKADAMSHVFGYTIINDVTARDLQKLHRQWFIGKSLDGFCPMGPFLVTADEIDAENIDVRCWINGELRQESNSKRLIFDISTIIETLSAGMELQPGDVIATGTPAGVGIGFNPPKFLQSGDVVRMEIPGIGILENEVA
ncbi:fumarylacetoacetate hydrolase family protein [Caballeronia sp. GAFFF1]|uniref:fumarylacetoacetate hydrolase family protein n=1 Tax=Caballeronia sp. GAFFF1 TaxID=2921779 RepID=UPI0020284060|nr:fumarylacetoacetate hydrolase family protein [Caballeronia sp. GAFFF1]